MHTKNKNIITCPLAAQGGRAIRCNLFFRTSKKGFPLLSLTQPLVNVTTI